jgi:hypothetical protein
MPLREIHVSIKVPFTDIGIEGTWQPDENERKASWEMYVELITRVSVVALRPEEGLLREALSSLYALFDTTRAILREYGPGVAKPKGKGRLSFGNLSVTILNAVLRPLLAKWHPLLLDYENTRATTISALEHERNWARNTELRQELAAVRGTLIAYADVLAEVAGVPSLIAPLIQL